MLLLCLPPCDSLLRASQCVRGQCCHIPTSSLSTCSDPEAIRRRNNSLLSVDLFSRLSDQVRYLIIIVIPKPPRLLRRAQNVVVQHT
jgi:hypothetical protein